MFNRSGFNRLAFSRPYELIVNLSVVMDGIGELISHANVDYQASLSLDGVGEFSASAIRELFSSIQMYGVGELQLESIRERFATIVMNGLGTLGLNAKKYHIDSIRFTGDFNPGDRIEIDSKKLKILKNGVNISGLMQGDFFDLNTGINNVNYTDTETGRSVLFRVSYRDKFLY